MHKDVETFKKRGNVPHIDASSFHKLTQRNLQEEYRNASQKYEQHIGNEEHSCEHTAIENDIEWC